VALNESEEPVRQKELLILHSTGPRSGEVIRTPVRSISLMTQNDLRALFGVSPIIPVHCSRLLVPPAKSLLKPNTRQLIFSSAASALARDVALVEVQFCGAALI
jgi:hypothetical protein